MTGLYHIVHLPSGRTYIGSSTHVARRLKAHRTLLERGAHDNIWLQRTWSRDGAGAFAFKAGDECPLDLLREREAQAIADFGGKLFNLSPVVRRGARAPNSALSDDDVRELHRRAAAGESTASLMRAFGLKRFTVGRIISGRTYAHVTGGQRARGRMEARGEGVGRGKLTEAQAQEILDRSLAGEDCRALADEFSVTNAVVYGIRRRAFWKHLHATPSAAISSGV